MDYSIETVEKSHTQPSTNAAIKRSSKCSERIFARRHSFPLVVFFVISLLDSYFSKFD